MLRSMYSAISGMQAFQTDLDVVGNNIANVNTVGFKSGRTDFSDIMSQTLSGGTAAGASTGGVNPQQVGLGVKVADIQNLFSQGADQTTGNPTDLAIQGGGMFVVTPNTSSTPMQTLLTRAGNFAIDSKGNLTLPDGSIALGYGTTPPTTGSAAAPTTVMNINTLATANLPAGVSLSQTPNVQIGQNGSVSVQGTDNQQHIIGYLGIATVSNYGGLEKVGDSLFQVSGPSGAATYESPGVNGAGTIASGTLEMSNVDLTKEMTEMIVAQNAFAANSHIIGTDNTILQDVVNMKNS